VAEGQLTEEQYSDLITTVNGMLKSGQVDKYDLTSELRSEVDKVKNKIDKGEVTVYDINKNKGLFDQTYLTEELLQQIAGTASINAVPEDGSITRKKIASKAISPNETSFIKTPNNLIAKEGITDGVRINTETGALETSDTSSVSDFFEVTYLEEIISKDLTRCVFYDENYGVTGSNIKTDEPINVMGRTTKYARAQFLSENRNTAQVNRGSTLLDYDEGFYKFEDAYYFERPLKEKSVTSAMLSDNSVTEEKVDDGAITPSKTNFIKVSKNLIDGDAITYKKTIDSSTGEVVDAIYSDLTDFILVKSGTQYTGIVNRVSEYNENKVFIRSYGNLTDESFTFKTTPDTKYLRLSFHEDVRGQQQLYEGTELLPYEPYGMMLNEEIKVPNASENQNEKPYYISAEAIPDYFNSISDIDYDISYQRNKTSYADFVSKWDALIKSDSSYFSKTVMGKDESGTYDVIKVSASPDRVLGSKKPLIKIIFITGIHGGEKSSMFSVYYLFKSISEKWKENEALEYLRWNVHFEFIICASPWGFDNGSGRHNVNGVDINRNFEEAWVESTEGDKDYGGTEPFSEAETRHIKELIDNNKDAVYYGDYHNHYSQDQHHWMWIPLTKNQIGTDKILRWGETTIRKCTLGFHKNFGFPYKNEGSGHISF